HAGAADERVEAAETRDGAFDRVLDCACVGNVAWEAEQPRVLPYRFRQLRLRDVGHGDGGAVVGEAAGNGQAESGRAARDQGLAVRSSSHGPPLRSRRARPLVLAPIVEGAKLRRKRAPGTLQSRPARTPAAPARGTRCS